MIDKTYSDAVKGLDKQILINCDTWYNYVLDLPHAQKVVYTVSVLNWQVENGGFHQYFLNSYGQFAYITIENLKLIGAVNKADLLDAATQLVNEDYLIEDTIRHLIFNKELSKIVDFDDVLFDKLNELDDNYYELEDEDIIGLLEEYLKK